MDCFCFFPLLLLLSALLKHIHSVVAAEAREAHLFLHMVLGLGQISCILPSSPVTSLLCNFWWGLLATLFLWSFDEGLWFKCPSWKQLVGGTGQRTYELVGVAGRC